jgi:hypothetical protein
LAPQGKTLYLACTPSRAQNKKKGTQRMRTLSQVNSTVSHIRSLRQTWMKIHQTLEQCKWCRLRQGHLKTQFLALNQFTKNLSLIPYQLLQSWNQLSNHLLIRQNHNLLRKFYQSLLESRWKRRLFQTLLEPRKQFRFLSPSQKTRFHLR